MTQIWLTQRWQALQCIVEDLIPNLHRLLPDTEPFCIAGQQIIQTIIAPGIRHTSDMYEAVVQGLCSFSANRHLLRLCRKDAWEAFLDAKFFRRAALALTPWKSIIKEIALSESDRFQELLSRLAPGAGVNISTSKEAEIQLRTSTIRKISFLILSCPIDHYANFLPSFWERLVDFIRDGQPVIMEHVYSCLRVVICRFHPSRLHPFWPNL